jgi:LuxR family transcriptional regulator, maltose regulon positive regulatory protein
VLRRRAARWCLRHGRPEEALEYFMAAGDVDTALRQGIAQLLSDDPEGAETFLEQAISSGEEVGAALRSQLAKESAAGVPGASSLTAAELRVLPLLATHLSFPEIGTEMFLSPHTVKSQAMSIYRKLGASSRHQAVTRARDLGLLEG